MADTTKLPRRKAMRLKDYDYSRPGAYFVTLCIKDHRQLLGTIQDGDMALSSCGRIVKDAWEGLPEYFPYLALDDFVIMPNHFHAILVIDGNPKGVSPKPKPLGRLVSAFKAAVTRDVNKHLGASGGSLWQRYFWERIIRNNEELNRIREYILYNPSQWEVDKLNPDAELRMNESITNRQDVEWQV